MPYLTYSEYKFDMNSAINIYENKYMCQPIDNTSHCDLRRIVEV